MTLPASPSPRERGRGPGASSEPPSYSPHGVHLGLIPSESLDAIRSRIDIAELAAEYIPNLQRAGRNLKARCPFHQERTPSFIINPERQTFHCFGCGEGGDAFTFVMKLENLGFTEAVEKLAARAGVKLEAQELGPAEKEKLKLKDLLSLAAEYYHKMLLSPQGAEARAYLLKRGLTAESLAGFKLGFAPKSGELARKAAGKGFTTDQLTKAGLVSLKGRDFFFDRVLYPIYDTKGAVVAFGGRTMGDGQPKYLNSPDSPLFSKSKVLYGLSHGLPAVRKERRILLMEGYMDVIAAHQYGFTTACAPLGTALTPDHAAMIKRYADQVIVVFDADSAGASAAIRGAEMLLEHGIKVRALTIPGAKDPDEYLGEHGKDAFAAQLEAAQDFFVFKTDVLVARAEGKLTPEVKSQIAKAVLDTIRKFPDEVVRHEWSRLLAQKLSLPEETVIRVSGLKLLPEIRKAPRKDVGETTADVQILAFLLKEPELARFVTEDDFTSPRAARVFKALPKPLDVLQDADDRRLVTRVSVESPPTESGEEALVRALQRRRLEKKFEQLRARFDSLQGAELLEYQRLAVELKGSRR